MNPTPQMRNVVPGALAGAVFQLEHFEGLVHQIACDGRATQQASRSDKDFAVCVCEVAPRTEKCAGIERIQPIRDNQQSIMG